MHAACIDLSLTAWVLGCLPTLHDKSSKTKALIQTAQCLKFNLAVESFPEAKSMAKAAIAR
jgi:hypothetical protein